MDQSEVGLFNNAFSCSVNGAAAIAVTQTAKVEAPSNIRSPMLFLLLVLQRLLT
jgi:hypothetical protein